MSPADVADRQHRARTQWSSVVADRQRRELAPKRRHQLYYVTMFFFVSKMYCTSRDGKAERQQQCFLEKQL